MIKCPSSPKVYNIEFYFIELAIILDFKVIPLIMTLRIRIDSQKNIVLTLRNPNRRIKISTLKVGTKNNLGLFLGKAWVHAFKWVLCVGLVFMVEFSEKGLQVQVVVFIQMLILIGVET